MRKYSAYTWDLVWALKSVSTDSRNTPATSIDFNAPNKLPRRNKNSRKSNPHKSNSMALAYVHRTQG